MPHKNFIQLCQPQVFVTRSLPVQALPVKVCELLIDSNIWCLNLTVVSITHHDKVLILIHHLDVHGIPMGAFIVHLGLFQVRFINLIISFKINFIPLVDLLLQFLQLFVEIILLEVRLIKLIRKQKLRPV